MYIWNDLVEGKIMIKIYLNLKSLNNKDIITTSVLIQEKFNHVSL